LEYSPNRAILKQWAYAHRSPKCGRKNFMATKIIQPLDDDELVNNLIERNADFQALLAKSAASPRKPFRPAFAAESPNIDEANGNHPH
jgi:hypothetical protein